MAGFAPPPRRCSRDVRDMSQMRLRNENTERTVACEVKLMVRQQGLTDNLSHEAASVTNTSAHTGGLTNRV